MLITVRKIIDNPFRSDFLIYILIINIVGSAWGYLWYEDQLKATPIKYWLFVPDCPFATTLMSIVLILFLFGKRNSTFELITYIALIKYGFWTVFVLSLDGLTGGQFTGETWMLFFSHLGMVIQGFFFIRFLKIKVKDTFIVIPWMLFNDFMDYGVGVYLYLPNPNHLPIIIVFTVSLTVIISVILLKRRKKSN